jgi:hypothetical protein
MNREALRLVHLPRRGAVTVGRSPAAAVVVDDPQVSPLHLRLSLSPRFAVEDLGSERGTFMWDSRVPPGEPSPVLPGQAIAIGATVLMLRRHQPAPRVRRLWTHTELAGLLDDECVRSSRTGARFAWAFIDVAAAEADADHHRDVTLDLLTRLDQALPPPHLFGRLAPRQVEALLVAAPGRKIEDQLRELGLSLRLGGYRPRIGVSFFPDDGATGLLLRHRAELRARALNLVDDVDSDDQRPSWLSWTLAGHLVRRVQKRPSFIFMPDLQTD